MTREIPMTSEIRLNNAFYLERVLDGYDVVAVGTDGISVRTVYSAVAQNARAAYNMCLDWATRQGVHWSGIAPAPALA